MKQLPLFPDTPEPPDTFSIVYCGEGENLPRQYEPVIALLKGERGLYPIFPAYWSKPLDPEAYKTSIKQWYIHSNLLRQTVVAWVKIPRALVLTDVDHQELISSGRLLLTINKDKEK